jgi:hypothetical protein
MTKTVKPQIVALKTLFETKKELENPRKFLVNIEIDTRKWIQKDIDEKKENVSINVWKITTYSRDI